VQGVIARSCKGYSTVRLKLLIQVRVLIKKRLPLVPTCVFTTSL
jgi:hypothetical protein